MSTAIQVERAAINIIDLTKEICPMTFVKAKLHLERMAPGQQIEFILNRGEQVQNVPASIKDEGHSIEAVRREGERYRILVRKTH